MEAVPDVLSVQKLPAGEESLYCGTWWWWGFTNKIAKEKGGGEVE